MTIFNNAHGCESLCMTRCVQFTHMYNQATCVYTYVQETLTYPVCTHTCDTRGFPGGQAGTVWAGPLFEF